MDGKEAWVAFDGDTTTNRQVNQQARDLGSYLEKRRASQVQFATLPPVDGKPKPGLDDYFAAGNRFTTITSMLGGLPPLPELKVRMEGVQLPVSDFSEALTDEVTTVQDPATEELIKRKTVLIEASVRVTDIEAERRPYIGAPVITVISGMVSWLEHFDGEVTRRETQFSRKTMTWLDGSVASPLTVISKLTGGKAAPRTSDKAGRSVINAWHATSQEEGQHTEVIRTTGLWGTQDGDFGFLTSNGLLTGEGLFPHVRGRVANFPDVELEYMDETVRDAKRIISAWKSFTASKDEIHASQVGLFETMTGSTLAAAVGLQPKGGGALFCQRRSGKSALLRMMGGWFGPKWHDRTGIMVQGKTPAILNERFRSISGGLITIDDAVDTGTASGGVSNKFEQQREFLQMAARAGYEVDAEADKSRISEAGDYDDLKREQPITRSVFLAEENFGELNFIDSTNDRLLTFQMEEGKPLLAKTGTIEGVIDDLRESKAQTILLSAILSQELRDSVGMADPRASMEQCYKAMERDVARELNKQAPEIDSRFMEYLAPCFIGFDLLAQAVKVAYEILADHSEGNEDEYYEEAEKVVGAVTNKIADNLIAAWRRHYRSVGKQTEESHRSIFQLLSDGITSGKLRLAVSSGKPRWGFDDPEPRGLLIGRVRKDGDVALIPRMVYEAVKQFNGRDMTPGKVRKLMESGVEKFGHRESIEGTDSDTRWLISKEVWSDCTGIGKDHEDDSDTGAVKDSAGSNVVSFPLTKTMVGMTGELQASGW